MILNDEIVENVGVVRYLGIEVDCFLSSKTHSNALCAKLSQMVGVLYKICHQVPQHVLKKVYFGLIHPHIMYIINGWGMASKNILRRVQVITICFHPREHIQANRDPHKLYVPQSSTDWGESRGSVAMDQMFSMHF